MPHETVTNLASNLTANFADLQSVFIINFMLRCDFEQSNRFKLLLQLLIAHLFFHNDFLRRLGLDEEKYDTLHY